MNSKKRIITAFVVAILILTLIVPTITIFMEAAGKS